MINTSRKNMKKTLFSQNKIPWQNLDYVNIHLGRYPLIIEVRFVDITKLFLYDNITRYEID